MHIETLKTFCDLVDSGSFSKAARQNFVSQSAVSQQLRALEERYGRRLIDRGPGSPLVLTEAGRLLYSEGKALLERFQALDHRLRRDAQVMAGTVRVATVYSVGLHALPPIVKQFLVAHPQVNVRVEYSRTDRVYEACLDGTIDLGIVAQPSRRAQIEIIPLRPEPLILVCSPEHRLAHRRTVRLEELESEPFVGFERNVPTRKAIDRILKEHGVAVALVTEFDNIETIKRSVEAGLGVAIVPQNCVKNEAKARTLVPLTFADGPYTRSIGIIRRKRREFGPTVAAFLELLTQGLG
jgi:LysR family transcriptional regulator, transcriptional activator of the cysJI operon